MQGTLTGSLVWEDPTCRWALSPCVKTAELGLWSLQAANY